MFVFDRSYVPPTRTVIGLDTWRSQFEHRVSELTGLPALAFDDTERFRSLNAENAVQQFLERKTTPAQSSNGNPCVKCAICSKSFQTAEYLHRHIAAKHTEELDQVREDAQFLENYLRDPYRPRPQPILLLPQVRSHNCFDCRLLKEALI